MSQQHTQGHAQHHAQNNQVPISFFVPFGTYLTLDQPSFTDAQANAARPPHPADFVNAMQQQFDTIARQQDSASNEQQQQQQDFAQQVESNGQDTASPPIDASAAASLGPQVTTSSNESYSTQNPMHSDIDGVQSESNPANGQGNGNSNASAQPDPHPNETPGININPSNPGPNAFSIFPILPREGAPMLVGPDGWPLQQWICFPPGVNPLAPPPNTPYYIFTTPMHPAFMPPPPKPKASKRTLENLPIVPLSSILPGEACPVCYEEFVPHRATPTAVSTQPDDGSRPAKKKAAISRGSPTPPDIIVRQMQPCGHLFCQNCLFEWLKQDIHCPMCRAEIIQDQDLSKGGFSMASGPRARNGTSCDVQPASLCNHSGEENVQGDPITTLETCHHRFHRSCLVTAARLQGLEEDEQEVAMRCPCCRVANKVSLRPSTMESFTPVELDVD